MSIYEEILNKLDELYGKITPKNLAWLDDLEKTLSLFMKFEKLSDFLTALETVKKEIEKSKKDETERLDRLIKELKRNEPNFLIEELKKKGEELARNKKLKEVIENEGFRLLEQIRLGKRDAVIGILLKSFASRDVQFPTELIEALKPKYDTNLFRAFMYAFLSGFIMNDQDQRSKDRKGEKGGVRNEQRR